MEATGSIIADLFIMFFAARLGGEVLLRLKQPAVVGEILAGVLIGPHALGLIGAPGAGLVAAFASEDEARKALATVLRVFADLGAIVLLFVVGLNIRAAEIIRAGPRTAVVATLEVVLSFGLGFALVTLILGESTTAALFVAAGLVATSVGVTARILSDLGRLQTIEARVILGAAVLDDLLGLIVLAAVIGAARAHDIGPLEIAAIAAQAIAFVALAGLAGLIIVRSFGHHMQRLHLPNAPFVVAVAVCLGLAALSVKVGLGTIIGAFLAGIVFAEVWEQHDLGSHSSAMYELLVPFFFVFTGSLVDWRLFLDPAALGVTAALIPVAVAGKVLGAGLGALGMGWRRMAVVGVGMVPRGEVTLIAATAGATTGAISERLFAAVIMVAVVTTLVVPSLLAALYARATEREN